jgi:hypothetical protein
LSLQDLKDEATGCTAKGGLEKSSGLAGNLIALLSFSVIHPQLILDHPSRALFAATAMRKLPRFSAYKASICPVATL